MAHAPAKRQTEVLTGIDAELASIRELDNESLRKQLSEALKLTAQSLLRLAAIIRTLEERGEDLSGLRIGLLPYLRQIAYGQVLPETVIRYAESPMLVQAISRLPLPDQRRLATGEAVPFALRKGDGSVDHRLVDPLLLRREQVNLIFVRDHIRTVEEQIAVLEARPQADAATVPASRAKVQADRKRGGIQIGRVFAPANEVTTALAELVGPDSDETDRTATVNLKLTEEEHRRLKTRSAEIDVPMGTLVRRALRANGLI